MTTTNETKLLRSIRSIDLNNRLNSYLIEFIFNSTKSNINQEDFKAKKTLFDLLIGRNKLKKNAIKDDNFSFNNYSSLVNYFFSKVHIIFFYSSIFYDLK